MIGLISYLLNNKIDFLFDSKRKNIIIYSEYSSVLFSNVMSHFDYIGENETKVAKAFVVCSSFCVVELN